MFSALFFPIVSALCLLCRENLRCSATNSWVSLAYNLQCTYCTYCTYCTSLQPTTAGYRGCSLSPPYYCTQRGGALRAVMAWERSIHRWLRHHGQAPAGSTLNSGIGIGIGIGIELKSGSQDWILGLWLGSGIAQKEEKNTLTQNNQKLPKVTKSCKNYQKL